MTSMQSACVCLQLCAESQLNHCWTHIASIIISIATLPSLQSSPGHTLQPDSVCCCDMQGKTPNLTGIKPVTNKSREASKLSVLMIAMVKHRKAKYIQTSKEQSKDKARIKTKGRIITVYMAKNIHRCKGWQDFDIRQYVA